MTRRLIRWYLFVTLLATVGSQILHATSISGSVSDLTTKPVSNSTFVRFELKNCGSSIPQVTGQTTVVAQVKDILPNGNGVLTGTLTGNDSITCAGLQNTYYHVTVWDGTSLQFSANYLVTGTAFNINSAATINPDSLSLGQYQPGDLQFSAGIGKAGVLHGNATTTLKFLGMRGDGTLPTTWDWLTLTPDDLPDHIPASKIDGISSGGGGSGYTKTSQLINDSGFISSVPTALGFTPLSTTLSNLANAANARTALGIGTAGAKAVEFFDLAGAASTAQTVAQSSSLQKSANLSDVGNKPAVLTNLGIKSAALHEVSEFDATGAASAVASASLAKSSNLSDVANKPLARVNMGLGNVATLNTNVPLGVPLTDSSNRIPAAFLPPMTGDISLSGAASTVVSVGGQSASAVAAAAAAWSNANAAGYAAKLDSGGKIPSSLLPASLNSGLTLGTSGQFVVSASGNLTRINNIPWSFPVAHTAGCLYDDGAGNISQVACSGSGGGGSGSSYYQLFSIGGTPLTARAKFNFIQGSNITLTATDNGTDTTSVRIDGPSLTTGLQPTGGTNYLPYVVSGTTVAAATSGNLLSILGAPYNALSGNGNKVATVSGTIAAGDLLRMDSNGNLVDSGIANAGTVTSVGVSLPLFTTSGAINTSGTITGTLVAQQPGTVFGGPATGVAGTPGFRALVGTDIPAIDLTSTARGGVSGQLPYTSISGRPTLNYQTFAVAGTPVTARSIFNVASADSNITITPSDNGTTQTTFTFACPGCGGGGGGTTTPFTLNYQNSATGSKSITQQVKNQQTVQADEFATCDGTTLDTTGIANAAAAGAIVELPANRTCIINNLAVPANTMLRGKSGSVLKWQTGQTGSMLKPAAANVTVENIIFDLNGNLPSAANVGAIAFVAGASNFQFRNNTIINTGSPSMLNPALSITGVPGVVQNLRVMDGTVTGTHLFIDSTGLETNKILVSGFFSKGSNRNAIQIYNNYGTTTEGVANVEIQNFDIQNVTDTALSNGLYGNAIAMLYSDGVYVHDGSINGTRYSAWRLTAGAHNKAHDIRTKNTGDVAFYADNGSWGNELHDLTLTDGYAGVKFTGIATRPQFPNDAPNVAHDITVRNMRGYAAWLEHDVARNFLVDGTPFGAVNGAGSNTGNNAVSGINCTRSNTAYPQVDVCLLLDTNMKTSAIDTVANITTSNYTPVISNIIGSNLAASVVVSGISKAAQAVVSYSSGTQPVTGAVFCFYGVSGMTQMNGQCPSVVSSTGSTFTVNLNTTAYSTYVAASGGQTANATAFFSSGTTPQYSLPTNAKFANVEVPFSILSTQSTTTGAAGQNGSTVFVPDASCGTAGACGSGTQAIRSGGVYYTPAGVALSSTGSSGGGGGGTLATVGTRYSVNPESVPSGAVSVTGAAANGTTDDLAVIQAAVNANTITVIPNGVYKLSDALQIPAGKTVFSNGATLKGNSGAYPLCYINGNNVTIKGITFDGGSVIAWDVKSGLTIKYNTFKNHTIDSVDNLAQNNLLHFGLLQSSTISDNQFLNDMPPGDLDPANYHEDGSGSDPDYGGGSPKTAIWFETGASNTSIDHNTFDYDEQGIKFASGSTTPYANLYIGYNLATRMHRMFFETQQYHSNMVIEYNVAKNWYLHYWESYPLSVATPPSTGTIVRGNYLQSTQVCNDWRCGLGIEFGSQNGQVYNNTIMGPYQTGSIQIFGGSNNNSVHDNRACTYNTDPDYATVSMGADEDNGPVTGTVTANNDARTGVNSCAAVASSWAQYDISLPH
jgi:hypothetical protein